jgi:4-hydroxy-3-methylbut-2-enyl diphosphate reductase
MDIIKLTPRGFCKGVVRAIHIINKALENDNLKKPIYMLGNIVHNKNIVKAFEEKGIIILDGSSREEMLKKINEGTIIFTAHGVSDKIRDLALNKNLDIIDATCIDVTKTHDLIKEKLKEGYTVLFYGKSNHPETEGILGISDEIILIEEATDLSFLPPIKNKMIITNQTTMSYLELINVYEKLKVIYPQLELMNEVCSATRRRQEAVLNAQDLDLIIVVGDKLSNNTRMLKEIALKKNVQAIQVETIVDLKNYNLTNYKKIGITAGASTPNAIVQEIIDNLEFNTNNYISTLNLEDYLKG